MNRTLLTFALLLSVLPMPVLASPHAHTTTNVRSAGMADTLLASDAEPSSVFNQLTGLAAMETPAIATLFNKPYAGLPGVNIWASEISAAMPVGFGQAGLGYARFQVNDVYCEQVVALGYAAPIMDGLAFVIGGKYLLHEYIPGDDIMASADPVFTHGTSRGVFAADAGLRYSPNPSWRFAVIVRDLNQPDWGLTSADQIPAEVQTGAAFFWHAENLLVALDVSWKNPLLNMNPEPLVPALGIEKKIAGDLMAFRIGATPDAMSAGLGWHWQSMKLDYAVVFKFGLLADNFGTHHIGLGYAFNSAPPKENPRTRPPKAGTLDPLPRIPSEHNGVQQIKTKEKP